MTVRLIFATWPAVVYQGVVLTHEKAEDRLLSFVFTKELQDGELRTYVEQGWIDRDEKSD